MHRVIDPRLLQIAVANDMDLSHPFVNSPQHQVGAVLRVPSPYLRRY